MQANQQGSCEEWPFLLSLESFKWEIEELRICCQKNIGPTRYSCCAIHPTSHSPQHDVVVGVVAFIDSNNSDYACGACLNRCMQAESPLSTQSPSTPTNRWGNNDDNDSRNNNNNKNSDKDNNDSSKNINSSDNDDSGNEDNYKDSGNNRDDDEDDNNNSSNDDDDNDCGDDDDDNDCRTTSIMSKATPSTTSAPHVTKSPK